MCFLPVGLPSAGCVHGHSAFLQGVPGLPLEAHGSFFDDELFSWQRGFIPSSFPLFSLQSFSIQTTRWTCLEDVTLESALLKISFKDDQPFILPSSWYLNFFLSCWLHFSNINEPETNWRIACDLKHVTADPSPHPAPPWPTSSQISDCWKPNNSPAPSLKSKVQWT